MNFVLNYTPVFNAKRNPLAARIQCAAAPGGGLPDLAMLHDQISQNLAAQGLPVIVAVDEQTFDDSIRSTKASESIWISVPVSVVNQPESRNLIRALGRARHRLVLSGAPEEVTDDSLLEWFYAAFLSAEQCRERFEQRVCSGIFGGSSKSARRRVAIAHGAGDSMELADRGFKSGSIACVGWPHRQPTASAGRRAAPADLSTVSELLKLIDRGADIAEIDTVARNDAVLTYRFLQLINSAAFGLSGGISSFRQGVMLIGYAQLRRWLAVMLASAAPDLNARPYIFDAIRRASILEKLAMTEPVHEDPGNAFTLGMYSLLEQIFGQSFDELFESIPVQPAVRDALLGNDSSLTGLLVLVKALESNDSERVLSALQALDLTPEQCNKAVLASFERPKLLNPN